MKVKVSVIVTVTMEASSSCLQRVKPYWRKKGNTVKGQHIGSRNTIHMVAEPDSDPWQRQARKRFQVLEKKVKDLESAVKDSTARGVLTNVQVNHLRDKVAQKTKERVAVSPETEE